MQFNDEFVIKRVKEIISKDNLDKLYADKYLSTRKKGFTKENHLYTEVISEVLYNFFKDDKKIPGISESDTTNYCKVERSGNGNGSKLDEETIQREFFNGTRRLDKLGDCIYIELPSNGYGKGKGIDLVFYDGQYLSIVELKANTKESIIKPILEIQTYFQRIDWEQAIIDLVNDGKLKNTVPLERIKKYILIPNESDILDEYKKMPEDGFTKKLMNFFDIELITYNLEE